MRKLVGSQAELRVVIRIDRPAGAPNLTRFPVPKRADGACLNCVHQRGATRRAERMRRARIPRPCKQLVGEAGALVDVLRVQQAGRATTTILALRSGECRVLRQRGSILPCYRSSAGRLCVCARVWPHRSRAGASEGRQWSKAIVVCSAYSSQVKSSQMSPA